MTTRQLRQREAARASFFAGIHLGVAGDVPEFEPPGNPHMMRHQISELPQRPDDSILSEAIPLFYIGQNHNGFWVVRDSEGRSGGLFWRKQSALHFAKKKSEPSGCALMVLDEPLELDIENRGSRIVGLLGATLNAAARCAPALVSFIGAMVAKWLKLVRRISRARAAERRHREALETELFHGQYTLSSKNDDDLPIP
jgi:hypothetical protein